MTRPFALTFGLCAMCVLALAASSRAQEASTPPPQEITADLQDAKPPAPAQAKPSTRVVTGKEQKGLAEAEERERYRELEQRQKEMAEADARKREHYGPNVRIELTLTDQKPGAPATSKTVVITTSNENWGRLRSEVNSTVYGAAPLNVDARPFVMPDGRVSVQLTVEYSQGRMPDAEGNTERIVGARINESLTAVLESGKPLVITQSADPTSDRKVTVEVKATVLR
jgi:hypothetical protein